MTREGTKHGKLWPQVVKVKVGNRLVAIQVDGGTVQRQDEFRVPGLHVGANGREHRIAMASKAFLVVA